MIERLQHVYIITNMINGKKYVGRTVNPTKRWRDHKQLSQRNVKRRSIIHRAMSGHGVENFSYELYSQYETLAMVKAAEAALIKTLRTDEREFGYNLSPGGKDIEFAIQMSVVSRRKARELDPDGCFARHSARWKAIHAARTPEQKALAQERRRAAGDPSLWVRGLVEYNTNPDNAEKRKQNARKAAAKQTTAQRSERGKRAANSLTPEERRARVAKGRVGKTREDWVAAGKKGRESWTAEKKSEHARKVYAARRLNAQKDPEGYAQRARESARRASQTMGPEGHRARMLKSWETRRRNTYNNTLEALLGAA